MTDNADRPGAATLPESEAMFAGFFNQGNIGCAITLPGKGLYKVNAKFCHMLQYTERELLAMSWPELTHPDDLAHDLAQFNRTSDGEVENYQLPNRVLRNNGAVLHTHLPTSCARHQAGSTPTAIATL